MKPEAQRIAIAKACGVPNVQYDRGETIDALPDYLSDLDAMHEAEMVLNRVQKSEFCLTLWQMTGEAHIFKDSFSFVHATAAQRAEAFLRTIGKWIE